MKSSAFHEKMIQTLEVLKNVLIIAFLLAIVVIVLLGMYTLVFGETFGMIPVSEELTLFLNAVGFISYILMLFIIAIIV